MYLVAFFFFYNCHIAKATNFSCIFSCCSLVFFHFFGQGKCISIILADEELRTIKLTFYDDMVAFVLKMKPLFVYKFWGCQHKNVNNFFNHNTTSCFELILRPRHSGWRYVATNSAIQGTFTFNPLTGIAAVSR